jgi:hypothetical protein
MRQEDMKRLLWPGLPIPEGQLFEGSTKSTPAVKLNRLKKELERKTDYTLVRRQCYWLPQCELPEGLKNSSPVLYAFATAINGSTAQSIDQLSARVWGAHGATENNVQNDVYRLRHDYGLNVVSTGYRQMIVNTYSSTCST